jgi:hypothetical protein
VARHLAGDSPLRLMASIMIERVAPLPSPYRERRGAVRVRRGAEA